MTFVHHVTGRLRLKFPELKNRRALCQAVEKSIRTLPMVRLVQANAVTGSLLIHYDARGTQQAILLRSIQDTLADRFGLEFPNNSSEKNAADDSHFLNDAIAERMTKMIIDKIVERSALALIGLLI